MVRMIRLGAALLFASVVSACASPQSAPKDHFYVLDPPVSTAGVGPPRRAALLVNDLAARGFVGGRQIVFRTNEQPLEVKRYPQHLWEEPPGRALAGALVEAVRAAGLFEFVFTPAQRTRSDYILGGELSRFEHLPTGSPPRVAVDFTLTVTRGSDRRSLLSRRYAGEEPTGGSTPEDMVRAFNRLTGRLLRQVLEDLRSLDESIER